MKKIIIVIFILFSAILLVSCKKNNTDDKVDELLNKYEEYNKKIEELLKSQEDVIKDLETTQKTLEEEIENQQKLIDELKEEGKNTDDMLLSLLELVEELEKVIEEGKILSEFKIIFMQDGDSLNGTLAVEFPKLFDDFQFSDAKVTLRHPLRSVYEIDTEVETYELNRISNIDIEVLYHGLYELDFEVTYTKGSDSKVIKTSQSAMFSVDTVNISWLNGTMPTLLFAADLFNNKFNEGHTYIEIERSKTYNFDELPENTHKFPLYASATNGDYNQVNIPEFWDYVKIQTDGRALHWVKELFVINNNVNINFALVDNVLEAVNGMYMLDIPEENFNLILYTDGLYTDNWINEHIKNDEQIEFYRRLFSEYRNRKLSDPTAFEEINNSFALVSSELPNIEYVVNQIDSWLIKDSELLDLFNLRVVSTHEAFENVEANGKLNEMEYLFNTRWGDGLDDSMYSIFNQSSKKNLLILGTSPAGEDNANYASFDSYIEYIVSTYGSEYDIFYKGHPRHPSSEERIAYFEENNIIELVNSIPVETLMVLYEDVYIGGYAGTSFISSLEDQTIFLFGSQEYIMSSQLALKALIDEGVIFKNTEYLSSDFNN